MDLVYSAIPAGMVGREQEIEIGPMSGRSNVTFWLEKRGIVATEALVDRIFQKAKRASARADRRRDPRGSRRRLAGAGADHCTTCYLRCGVGT